MISTPIAQSAVLADGTHSSRATEMIGFQWLRWQLVDDRLVDDEIKFRKAVDTLEDDSRRYVSVFGTSRFGNKKRTVGNSTGTVKRATVETTTQNCNG